MDCTQLNREKAVSCLLERQCNLMDELTQLQDAMIVDTSGAKWNESGTRCRDLVIGLKNIRTQLKEFGHGEVAGIVPSITAAMSRAQLNEASHAAVQGVADRASLQIPIREKTALKNADGQAPQKRKLEEVVSVEASTKTMKSSQRVIKRPRKSVLGANSIQNNNSRTEDITKSRDMAVSENLSTIKSMLAIYKNHANTLINQPPVNEKQQYQEYSQLSRDIFSNIIAPLDVIGETSDANRKLRKDLVTDAKAVMDGLDGTIPEAKWWQP